MFQPGLGWKNPVRTFRNFFGRYGITGGSMRGVFNGIQPVAVVDRYRDNSEGSLFALTMTASVIANRYAAFALGSSQDDWELHAFNYGLNIGAPGSIAVYNIMIYTPDSTYNPVQTPSPPGYFVPGLNLDWAFTLSTVSGICGYNVNLPTRFGTFPIEAVSAHPAGSYPGSTRIYWKECVFDPPIRVWRDLTLGFIMTETHGNSFTATVSVRYTLRPRTTRGPGPN